MKIEKLFFLIISIALALGAVFFIPGLRPDQTHDLPEEEFGIFPIADENKAVDQVEVGQEFIDDQPVADFNVSVFYSVPFISQAPSGNWADERQSNACEEASVYMAISWAKGESIVHTEAERLMIEISEFELSKYGEFRDTSAQDTLDWIVKDFFGYENAWVVEDINTEDIIIELQRGNIVVVPVHGQRLNNPYFTPPGPVEHKIVITGYDSSTEEFVTNDPGTRRGEGMRYSQAVLEGAIRDYATGHKEVMSEWRTAMIVFSRDI